MFEQLSDAGQIFGGTEILVASVARNFATIGVKHLGAIASIVRSAERRNLVFPMSLLTQQFVDLVVQIADAELTKTG